MTEWVTVKVPEADREMAKETRPDGATYGDCLVAGAQELADSPTLLAGGSIQPIVDEEVEKAKRALREEIEAREAAAFETDFPTAEVKTALRAVLREELVEGALR